jgi:succinate dehydrogenase / fumarate reductase flavoprotein subunit
MRGKVNPFVLHRELGEVMVANVTIVRENKRLKATLATLDELSERWGQMGCPDPSPVSNQPLAFMNQLWNMIEAAKAITAGALARDESRGAHYKPEFPKRDDKRWLKTTLAAWTPKGPKLSYRKVETPLLKPVERHYD